MTTEPAELVPAAPLPTVPTPETLLDQLDATNPALALAQQLQLATDRAAWLGARLAEQVAREGVGGVVGDHRGIDGDGRVVKLSEYARQLAEQEFRERQHVASLSERIARLGLDAGAHNRDIGRTAAEAMKALVVELGLSLDDQAVLEAAQRVAGRIGEARQRAR